MFGDGFAGLVFLILAFLLLITPVANQTSVTTALAFELCAPVGGFANSTQPNRSLNQPGGNATVSTPTATPSAFTGKAARLLVSGEGGIGWAALVVLGGLLWWL